MDNNKMIQEHPEQLAMEKRRKNTAEVAGKRSDENIAELVQNKIEKMQESGEIHFPANYSVSNAIRSAWLQIQETKDLNDRPALEVCTRESVANALLNTVIQGLSPSKKQVYYIVYKNQLLAQRSYFGTISVTKRIPLVKDVWADVVYDGDVFQTKKHRGGWKILEYESSPEQMDPGKIKYAYAVIEREGEQDFTEIMTWDQIQKSWAKSRSKNQNVHKEFPDQMAKRTVINRACKMFFNTCDDSDLLIEAFHATEDQYENQCSEPEKPASQNLATLNAELIEEVVENE